ncbi:hypothetical protein [Streptomyces sp.]|uniref:hypothetical protein n=1 Tax=Streptomyces sp. TaxID=1931 RepID=UPI002D7665A1|nr:hypothetical protein [Streptomyces sp.]HET6356495.1 hypothetical protein [Streptomyces sp.]
MDAIREEAERYYNQTKGHYGDALCVESEAREKCIADVKAAYKSIPDYQGTIPDPEQFRKGLAPLRTEAREASDNPNVQLPGSGPKVDSIPTIGSDVVISETLMRIANRVNGLPEGQGNNYWLPSNSDEGRREYISGNKELIRAAAADAGLPPEMVAGIAWQEVEDDPRVIDDAAYEGRKLLPGSEDPDRTSMGPMAIQVRRAAEVLGYDPHNLTDLQRSAVVDAIRDPAKNIFILHGHTCGQPPQPAIADRARVRAKPLLSHGMGRVCRGAESGTVPVPAVQGSGRGQPHSSSPAARSANAARCADLLAAHHEPNPAQPVAWRRRGHTTGRPPRSARHPEPGSSAPARC